MIKPVPFAITMVFFVLCLKWYPANAQTLMLPRNNMPGTDTLPDLAAGATETLDTARVYRWDFDLGCDAYPPDTVLHIEAGAHLVADCPDPAPVKGIAVSGILEVTGKLRAGTVMTYPGSLTLALPGAKLAFSGWVDDPHQWTLGLVATGGAVRLQGGRTPTTHVQIAPAAAGALTLALSAPVTDWRPGDTLYLAPTYVPDQAYGAGDYRWAGWLQSVDRMPWELAVIAAVDDQTVTLAAPLQYDHDQPFHVLHMTRDIQVYSESGCQDPERLDCAHLAALGATDWQMHGVEVRDMGRTQAGILNNVVAIDGDLTKTLPGRPWNQIGRYGGFHAHHLTGHMPRVTHSTFHGDDGLDGRNSPKVAWVCHRSHCVFEHNVSYGVTGLMVSEEGAEAGRAIGNVVSVHGNIANGPNSLLPLGLTGWGGPRIISDNTGLVATRLVDPIEVDSRLLVIDPDIERWVAQSFGNGHAFWWRDNLFSLTGNVAVGIFPSLPYASFVHPRHKPVLVPLMTGELPPIIEDILANPYHHTNHGAGNWGFAAFEDNIADGYNAGLEMSYNQGMNVIEGFTVIERDPDVVVEKSPCINTVSNAEPIVIDLECNKL